MSAIRLRAIVCKAAAVSRFSHRAHKNSPHCLLRITSILSDIVPSALYNKIESFPIFLPLYAQDNKKHGIFFPIIIYSYQKLSQKLNQNIHFQSRSGCPALGWSRKKVLIQVVLVLLTNQSISLPIQRLPP